MFKSPFQICDNTVEIEFRFVRVEDFKNHGRVATSGCLVLGE